MKKIFLTMALLLSINSVFAANWKSIGNNQSIDLSSIKKSNNNYTYAWIKEKHTDNWRWHNQLVESTHTYLMFDCKSKKMCLLGSEIYGTQGNLLNKSSIVYNAQNPYNWLDIKIDPKYQVSYNEACKLVK